MILRALPLASSPPSIWNLTSSAMLSVQEVANQFSKLFERPAKFFGRESDTAFLSNPAKLFAAYAMTETMAQNDAGQHLYPACGFVEVARQSHFARKL